MNRIAIVSVLAALAVPAAASSHGSHHRSHHRGALGAAITACKAERDASGVAAFRTKYHQDRQGHARNRQGLHRKLRLRHGHRALRLCVRAHVKPARKEARMTCKSERTAMGVDAFRAKYAGDHRRHAFRRCVRTHVRDAVSS